MKLNIMHIAPDFYYSNGRAQYVYNISRDLIKNGHKAFILSNQGDAFKRLDDANIPYQIFEKLHHNNVLNYYKIIKNIIDKYNINLIHTHHRKDDFYLFVIKKIFRLKISNCLTVLSIRNDKHHLSYFSHNLIAVSNAVKKNLTGIFKIPENLISVIPNYIIKNDYNPITKNFNRENIAIFSAGRFHKEKDFTTLINSISLSKYKSKINLILVGEGELKNSYEKLITDLKVNATFNPPCNDISEYFNQADICVLPSIIDPFPFFMLLSGLFKKPFIGSNVDGIAELIQNKLNGFLFPTGNEKALSEKIDYVIDNYSSTVNMTNKLYEDVLNKYTSETVYPQLEKYYFDLVKFY